MTKIGIIGYGIVGQAVAYGFKGCNIKFYDKFKNSNSLQDVCNHAEYIFICLPTPYKENRIDLTIIEDSVREIVQHTNGTNKLVVIKSTVVPGTTRRLAKQYPKTHFAFNPEFLTEANFLEDFVNADRHVIGADNNKNSLGLTALYAQHWPKAPIYQTDTTTAELAKYASNAFLATKVMFANEFDVLCKEMDVEWAEVKKIVVADSRIGPTHLDVTSLKGFGGKCFPKDLIAILGLFDDLGIDASLLKTVWKKNLSVRKVRDWEDIPFVKTED
jgi:UDPglucose 6-dehydrogenase